MRYFSATLFSGASAKSGGSFAFLSVNGFSRLVLDRFIPPYLAFSFCNVAGRRTDFRQSSEVGKPASCALVIPIIGP